MPGGILRAVSPGGGAARSILEGRLSAPRKLPTMQHLSIRFLIGLARASDGPDGPHFTLANIRADAALAILARHYPAFSAVRGTGYWRGAPEPSLSVEAVVNPEEEYWHDADVIGVARSIAGEVARALSQESVAVVVTPVSFSLEGPHGVQQ